MNHPQEMRRELLVWYDRHVRDLPWRLGPKARAQGVRPDPYRVWLSEIMLQQTTVPHAAPYFAKFTGMWPTVQDLAAAERDAVLAAWAGLGYYARARNLHKCAQEVAERGGFPETRDGLKELPGVGDYTSAAIAAIAFDAPVVPVDGNIERVMSRIFAIETPLPKGKAEIKAAAARFADANRPGDFAQALMDLGATICTPRSPACALCPWRKDCDACAAGTQDRYPRKAPKKAKPHRKGVAFWLVRDGAVLLRRQPDRGLLGGMWLPPSTPWREEDWGEAEALSHAPAAAEWSGLGAEARHVFTHFSLSLDVWRAEAPETFEPGEDERFAPVAELKDAGVPSVGMKVAKLAR